MADLEQNFFDFAAPRLGELSVYDAEVVSFDFETTGLDPFLDRIIEIGALVWKKGAVTERFHTMVDPGIPVPPRASEINGIRDEDLVGAPGEQEAVGALVELLRHRAAIAHNLPFDYGFLEAAVRRCGLSLDGTLFLDSLTLSRKVYPGLPGYSLGALIQHLGFVQESAHRADSDAYDCGRLFFRCLEDDRRSAGMSIDKLIIYSGSRTARR